MAESSIGTGGSSVIDAFSPCNGGKCDNGIGDAWHEATSNVHLNHDLCVTWYPRACLLYKELIGS
jgi:hypothetical protein